MYPFNNFVSFLACLFRTYNIACFLCFLCYCLQSFTFFNSQCFVSIILFHFLAYFLRNCNIFFLLQHPLLLLTNTWMSIGLVVFFLTACIFHLSKVQCFLSGVLFYFLGSSLKALLFNVLFFYSVLRASFIACFFVTACILAIIQTYNVCLQ